MVAALLHLALSCFITYDKKRKCSQTFRVLGSVFCSVDRVNEVAQ